MEQIILTQEQFLIQHVQGVDINIIKIFIKHAEEEELLKDLNQWCDEQGIIYSRNNDLMKYIKEITGIENILDQNGCGYQPTSKKGKNQYSKEERLYINGEGRRLILLSRNKELQKYYVKLESANIKFFKYIIQQKDLQHQQQIQLKDDKIKALEYKGPESVYQIRNKKLINYYILDLMKVKIKIVVILIYQ